MLYSGGWDAIEKLPQVPSVCVCAIRQLGIEISRIII